MITRLRPGKVPVSVVAGSATTGVPAPGDGDPAPTGSPTGGGAIPARCLGTWEGPATGLGGTLPMGTFRVTVHQARVGESLGRLRQTDRIELTTVGDDLRYTSDSEPEGHPVAELTKTG